MSDEVDIWEVGQIPNDAQHVEDQKKVDQILEHIGFDDKGIFHGLFVKKEGGEYTDIWATKSPVPWIHKDAYKIR